MSQPSPDAKAVVRALDALTTQVRRLADVRQTPADDASTTPLTCPLCPTPIPFAVPQNATDHFRSQHPEYQLVDGPWPLLLPPDDAPTTADDGPHCVCGDPIEQTGDPAYWIHSPGSDTPCLDARPAAVPTKVITHWGPLSEQRFEEMRDNARQLTDWINERAQQIPAADEGQALRWARRESLLTLLSRAERGRPLTEDEARTLRHHVETEMRDADTARAVARSNLRHFRTIAAELAEAQAAIERVRGKVAEWREWKEQENAWAIRDIEGALADEPAPQPLDGTDQTTPE